MLHLKNLVVVITPRNHIHGLDLKQDVEEKRGDACRLDIKCNHYHNYLLGVNHAPKLLESNGQEQVQSKSR
jgi:hypothetical protein